MSVACLFCGQPERCELFDVWDDGAFQIETCCESLHEELCRQTPDEWKLLVQHLGIDGLTGHRLRRVLPEWDGMTLDFQLSIRPVSLADAKSFVRRHHAHCSNPPCGWRYGAAIFNGWRQIGVVMVGRPVARMLDHTTTVEVNRLCIRRDIAAGLRWNACSQAYAWAAREAKRRNFARIVTYTLDSESGTSLVAAGWGQEARTAGGTWSRPSRQRQDKAPVCAKIRWGKQLRGTHAPVGSVA